ncbi:MAG: GAF domain-containing protein [Anaerolineales bacterium]|nr:GAF domain-containing protein [Anaerolineales bacterium]
MPSGPILLSTGFLLLGLSFVLIVWALLRFIVPKVRPSFVQTAQPAFLQQKTHTDAILVVETGGRLRYINPQAREWFDLYEGETPHLERLARRVRPTESFLELCAAEGQARFSVNGKLVDAVSYRIPGTAPATLLALRRVENSLGLGDTTKGENIPGIALQTVTEFGQAIASSLSLEATIQATLLNVERLVATDFLELKIWDENSKALVIYRLSETTGAARTLQRENKSQFGEYAGFLVSQRKELFIRDTRAPNEVRYDPFGSRVPPMGSYIGLPLIAYGVLVGTLEVGVIPSNGFSNDDVNVLQLISGQAAIALRNAVLYEKQQRWNAQLLGLTHLSQTVGSLRDFKDLFSRLVGGLSPLFNVEMLGFLLYDEQRHVLEGQTPFHGLPNNIVQIYKTTIRPNSPAEEHINSQKTLTTADASQDPVWAELGLQDLAQAASMRDTTLIPLLSAGRFLGYLQLSNQRQGNQLLSQDDFRLLNLVANQVAAIIDNALLVQQARQRNQRAESLRRIASLVSSNATLDEIITYSLKEVMQLLQAEVGAVFLFDEESGVMRAHLPSVIGVPQELLNTLSRIVVKPSNYRLTVAGSQRPFLSGNLSKDRRVLPFYQAMVRRLSLESAIAVPLIVRGQGIGEMMLGARREELFGPADLQISFTVASQIAIAIENARRTNETQESLRRRATFLTTLARIVRELNTASSLKELMRVVYEESLRVSQAECGSAVLYEPGHTEAETAPVLFFLGHPASETSTALVKQARLSKQPVVVAEFNEQSAPPHTSVRSALAVALSYQDETFGFIELHAQQAGHFDETRAEIIKTIAVQGAIALQSAFSQREQRNRMETLRRRAEAFNQLTETMKQLRASPALATSLELLAQSIQKATPFNTVLISLNDLETKLLTRVAAAGIDKETFARIQTQQQTWTSVAQWMKPEFEINSVYFIPTEQARALTSNLQAITPPQEAERTPNAWKPEDMLLIPIYDQDERPLGLISVDTPRDGMRPDAVTLETLEAYAAQAAVIIMNGRALESAEERIQAYSAEVGRAKKLLTFSQRSLPILLHKDLDHTIAVANLAHRAQHIRAGLQLTEAISRQFDLASALMTLGQQVLSSFDMSTSLIARETSDGPRIVYVLGNVPPGANPQSLFGQRNPLRTCLQTGETLLSINIDEDGTWHDTPFLTVLRAKSFIAIPIIIKQKPIAALLAVNTEPMPAISAEDRQIYLQISRQISIILQNISQLNETRQRLEEVNLLLDFSRQLSGLTPNRILESLLQSALRVVKVAHAGVVFEWNPHEEALVPVAAMNYVDDEIILEIKYHLNEGLPGRVFAEKQPRRIDEINFANEYNLSAENLLKYQKACGGRVSISCMLIPIQTGSQNIGVLLLENFNTPAVFRPEDEALLLSLTQQVALSLENVRLLQTTQERTGQLQALNSVAATLTSSLRREELLASLLDRMKTVVPYDTATLWLRSDGKLVIAEARGFDDAEERKGLSVEIEDSMSFGEMIRTNKPIVVGDVRNDPRFASLTEATRFSWLGVPLIVKEQVIGVVALEKAEANFYENEIVQLATTFASQAAVAIDNATLFEESIQRAAELNERSQRLALLNQFSAELARSLNADEVLPLTARQLMTAMRAERAMILQLQQDKRALLLALLPEELGRPTLYRNIPEPPALTHIRESLTVYVSEDARLDTQLATLSEFLEDTASLMIVPIFSTQNRYVVVIQSREFGHFKSTEIDLARTISNQAAIALENADLYQSTRATAERLKILNQVSFEIGASLNADDIYRAVHQAAAKLMPVDAFVVALHDEESNEVDNVYIVDMGQRISSVRLPFGQGLVGQVIASGKPIVIMQAHEAEERGGVTVGEKGTPHSIIVVPMISGGKTIGAISAQSYQSNAYSENDQQILSTLANQATIALQNSRLLSETKQFALTLEQRVIERTAELEREQRNTETLLRILTEVSASLDLDRALSRTLSLLNEAIGAEQGTIMLLHPEDNMLHYRAGYGYVTQDAGRKASSFKLKVGEGLAGWVVKHRQPVLIDDLYLDPRWVISQSSQDHRSAIVAPLIVGEDVIGAIMVFHRKVGFFNEDSLEMVRAIGAQVAISINNAQLYELIRDQAERLGAMLRSQQMEASRQTAILEAVADGVLVTDPSNKISFVNASAQRILALPADKVIGKPVENFSGLFGKSTQTWVRVVQDWSNHPEQHHAGEMYAEQINLESGQVVLVHLSPVIWQKEFLGTVSIFRDITHEVEVDRLKSEFVATVSHELRTPMTSIRGYVDILLMGAAGALNENQAHFLRIVKNNTERLNILVNDLLDVSRIEAGRVSLTLQPLDLTEIVSEVVERFVKRAQDDQKPMEISFTVEDGLPRAMADTERIRQVIDNLVDNAYHYTPAEGKIQVHLRKNDGMVQIDVKDTGIGIPPDQHERVFDRFFRGEDPLVLATPGTGLGLSIVKQLVEMHHGKIWMTSTGIPGQGSTFSVTIPAYQPEE